MDGQVYPVIQVGTQYWLGSNLKVTHAAGGVALTTHVPNGDTTLIVAFGRLYDWSAAKRACMAGWHLPTDEDWTALSGALGARRGGALKDTAYWAAPNVGAANAFGFAARPAGYWNAEGFDNLFGRSTVFWSATPADTHFVWTRALGAQHDTLRRLTQHPNYGLSVRCVRD